LIDARGNQRARNRIGAIRIEEIILAHRPLRRTRVGQIKLPRSSRPGGAGGVYVVRQRLRSRHQGECCEGRNEKPLESLPAECPTPRSRSRLGKLPGHLISKVHSPGTRTALAYGWHRYLSFGRHRLFPTSGPQPQKQLASICSTQIMAEPEDQRMVTFARILDHSLCLITRSNRPKPHLITQPRPARMSKRAQP
jgi:hypothetical protein